MVTITDLEVILDGLKEPIEGYTTVERNAVHAKLRKIYEDAVDRKLVELNLD